MVTPSNYPADGGTVYCHYFSLSSQVTIFRAVLAAWLKASYEAELALDWTCLSRMVFSMSTLSPSGRTWVLNLLIYLDAVCCGLRSPTKYQYEHDIIPTTTDQVDVQPSLIGRTVVKLNLSLCTTFSEETMAGLFGRNPPFHCRWDAPGKAWLWGRR